MPPPPDEIFPAFLRDLHVALARDVVEGLTNSSNETKRAFGRIFAKSGVIPAFQTLSATMEMRSTQLYDRSNDDIPEPPFELIPIASIRLDLDSGDPDFICFQATEEQLASLQEKIEKLRKGLQQLKESVRVTQ